MSNDPIREAVEQARKVVCMTHAHDEDGNCIDEEGEHSAADVVEAVGNLDIALQEAEAAYQSIGDLPEAPAHVNVHILKAMLDLLAIAEQGEPKDEDERATLEAARAAARLAKAEYCEPCPFCTVAEQLCEACGGHGVVPKTPKPLRVLCHVSGGVASLAYDFGIEHVIADADEGEFDIPSDWKDLANQLDIATDDEADDEDDDDDGHFFVNYYTCPRCSNEWSDTYESQVDDECPKCGMRHISPHRSEDAEE